MPVSEPRRTFPRLVSALLVSAAVAVLSVPAAQSAEPAHPVARPVAHPGTPDLYRGQQWTLAALHLPRAWKYSRGNGVTVAVLDTGVDGHQADLTGRVIDGPDFTGHARKPGNRYWGRHGTEMASLIAGHGHGAGGSAGIMGVAPESKILSIRVTWELNDPMRTDRTQVAHSRDAIAKGIRYAADHGAQVISMSLGGGKLFYNGNPLEEAAIKYALGRGVVLVASSGNDGAGANRRNYPAAYPGVIAVGAVDRAFKPAKFTNRHTYVSVAAPGVEIVSGDVSGHGYVLGTGTSSSAALVAGVSALIKARYPNLASDEVKQALEQGTTHHPADGRSTAIGAGVADALGSLREAARINKAEHGDGAAKQPDSSATAAPPAANGDGGTDLILVAVLSGGGTLLVLSLILGWRQRRRRLAAVRAAEDASMSEPAPPPVEAAPWRSRPPAASARQGRPSGPSPWEPRSSASPSPSPWEPRSSTSPSPWEPRSSESPPPWEPRSRESSSPWGPRATEPPSSSDHRSSGPPPAVPRGSEISSWQPSAFEPASERSDSSGSTPTPEPPPGGATEPSRTEVFPAPAFPPADGGPATTGPTPHVPSSFPPSAEPPGADPSGSGHPAPMHPAESYEPPTGPRPGGRDSGPFPTVAQDFRTGGGPDPLSDESIESSADIGTPLAEQTWESIRRGFDQLKEDTRKWGTPLFESDLGTGRSTSWGSPGGTSDTPPAEPDDEAGA